MTLGRALPAVTLRRALPAVTLRRALPAVVTVAIGLFSIGQLTVPAEAQSPSEPVPCEVAMVVGCVATVAGSNATVAMTLRVSDVGDRAAGQNQSADGESGSNTGTGTDTGSAGDQEAEGANGSEQGSTVGGLIDGLGGLAGADSDRPLQSTVDPWEQGGLRANFGTGSIPISHYQIGADVTGWLGVPDPLDSFVASQTNWAFTTGTFLVLLATNALDWAFDFPMGKNLVDDAGVLAQEHTINFLGFGLSTSIYGLALSVTMVVAGFKAVTRGLVAAGSEVIVAFAAYVVLIVLTVTSGFGNAGLTVSRLSSDLSGSIATFAAGQDRQTACALELQAQREPSSLAGAAADADGSPSTSAGSSACSFGYALQRTMVELPYQNLQWGQVLDGAAGKERCAAINMELLAEGPWGNDDEPRDRMRSASECEENADFNHQASYIRLGIAGANAVTTGAVAVLILMVAAMLLWQQIKLLFLTVTMPHALVMAILPGRSRQLAWRWIELLIGVVIRTVILSLGLVVWLSLFSLIVYEQLTLRGIFLSLFASVAMAASGYWGLYKLSAMTRRRAGELGIGRTSPTATDRDRAGAEARTTGSGDSDRPGRPGGRGAGGSSAADAGTGPNRQSTTRRLVEGARSTVGTIGGGPGGTRSSGGTGNRPGSGAGLRSNSGTGSQPGSGAGLRSSGGTGSRPGSGAGTRSGGGRPARTGGTTRSPLIDRPQRLVNRPEPTNRSAGRAAGNTPNAVAVRPRPEPRGPGRRR